MKVKVKTVEPRKLIAVLGDSGQGVFFRFRSGHIYMGLSGNISEGAESLEQLLRPVTDRKPIYEGDEITLTF